MTLILKENVEVTLKFTLKSLQSNVKIIMIDVTSTLYINNYLNRFFFMISKAYVVKL